MSFACKVITAALLLMLLATSFSQQVYCQAEYKASIWLGPHYSSFDGNSKKVGEYALSDDGLLPEIRVDFSAWKENFVVNIDGHYFDDQNIFGQFNATFGDRFKASVRYRSLIHQKGLDLLENMQAREYFPIAGNPGGKIITNDLLDADVDHNTNRNEVEANASVLLSKKNNIRMIVAHRTIIETGTKQNIASNHCFSCHLTSKSADIDLRTYIVKAGIEAEAGAVDFGYSFGYRKFHNKEGNSSVYYDPAKHPVNGSSGDEFSTRVVFDDTTVAYNVYPETEKMSHRAKLGAQVGKGRLVTNVTYSTAENKRTELSSNVISGVASYSVPLSPRTRLVARTTVMRAEADDPFIDLPDFRGGRSGYEAHQYDFDYTRLSAIDRLDARGSAEVTTRLSRKVTLALLGGYEYLKRDDYPEEGAGFATKRFVGQAKLRYRQGTRYKLSFKYRFEKTSDPFVSAQGLFEERGREILETFTPPGRAFYYQREDLRYQDITTEPTDDHRFDGRATFRPTGKTSINLGIKGRYDKNGNLDSLDVTHLALTPDIGLMLTPDQRWTINTGYTYNYYKSRGPVAVALFDG